MDNLEKIERDNLSKQYQNIKITLESLYNKQIQRDKKIYDYLDYLIDALNIRDLIGGNLPIGTIVEWGGTKIPEDWLLCNGQSLDRDEYPELFEVLGTIYGGNDENNTFNLPQTLGKTIVGYNQEETDFNELGKIGGEKLVKLSTNNIPSHKHSLKVASALTGSELTTHNPILYANAGRGTATINNSYNAVVNTTGNGEAHNNLQPYVVLNYIIKVKQTPFIQNKVIDNLNSNSSSDALSAKQGNILKNLLNEGGTRNYEKLISKPQINNIILSGNRSLDEIGICELTKEDIKEIFGEESNE